MNIDVGGWGSVVQSSGGQKLQEKHVEGAMFSCPSPFGSVILQKFRISETEEAQLPSLRGLTNCPKTRHLSQTWWCRENSCFNGRLCLVNSSPFHAILLEFSRSYFPALKIIGNWEMTAVSMACNCCPVHEKCRWLPSLTVSPHIHAFPHAFISR